MAICYLPVVCFDKDFLVQSRKVRARRCLAAHAASCREACAVRADFIAGKKALGFERNPDSVLTVEEGSLGVEPRRRSQWVSGVSRPLQGSGGAHQIQIRHLYEK